MVVKELIEKLQAFPQDAVVVYRAWSEYNLLDDDDIWLAKSDDQIIVVRNGLYMQYIPYHWSKDEVPQFVQAVCFPGN